MTRGNHRDRRARLGRRAPLSQWRGSGQREVMIRWKASPTDAIAVARKVTNEAVN
jgi:hypothetical protein